ncbi:titin homolog isoform X2 [Rhopilema esculentum]|uniref:titin homolog isoform X2 n=1 Tax=Rhopilema esculentum TaxID=499914 RepID=UPI0031D6E0C9
MPRNEDRVRRDLEILGLELSASEDDKKKAFIKLALKLHPDRFSKSPDDSIKTKFHEVCKAYKRLTSDHCNTSDWNVDKSDEIFFSLLADSLQHNSKAALYGLFSELPNHKSHFQNDNEYRCKEDALDEDEDEDTEFNRLITILMNRLQNGKSLPAGLTQDKISKLKEDFIKHKEATKKCIEDEKITTTAKKPKATTQVPVTKPKPKSKKQMIAEQRRREKEMAKIAAELDEKRRLEEEKETAKKQLEEEKQRKLEEEQRRQEDERKRLAAQAKKRKEREDRERELKQQKENERLEKLKKQQEEELRRKEEEKKRKAEEKAAKSKALKEAKEKEEKEKQDQSKKQQGAKRATTNAQQQYQPQYQQYQQQQQKYPREVPPRFLRQMQQRQGPTSTDVEQHQQPQQQQNLQPKTQTVRKDQKQQKEEGDWDSGSDELANVNKSQETRSKWTENSTGTRNENWGQELSSGGGSLSDWGTVNVTEDWDAPGDSHFGSNWTEPRQETTQLEDTKTSEPSVIGTIGSELKSGKIPKKDSISGQFGVIGQPVSSSKDVPVVDPKSEANSDLQTERPEPVVNVVRDPLYKDVIEKKPPESGEKTLVDAGTKDLEVNNSQGSKTPKLTGWSGLDGFEPLPSYDKGSGVSQTVASVVEDESQSRTKVENVVTSNHKNVISDTQQLVKSATVEKSSGSKNAVREAEGVREADEWGWTTASSKKAKQKPSNTPSVNREANSWMSRSLKQLLDMGFKLEDAERALKENNGIIESAVSDLLSRADTTPTDKIHDQAGISSRRKDQLSSSMNDNTDEKLSNKKGQSKENRTIEDSRTQTAKMFTSDKSDFVGGNKLEEKSNAGSDAKGTANQGPVSMSSSSFLPTDIGTRFSDSNVIKSKPVGVIGSPLPGTSKISSQNSQRPLSTDDKSLLGATQAPISTPGQQISPVGSSVNQSLPQQSFPSFSHDTQAFPGQGPKLHHILQQSQGLPQPSLFPQQQILPTVPGTVSKDATFISPPLAANPNPGPQQSKLLQWTQQISMEARDTVASSAQSEQDASWNSITSVPGCASATITPVGAPVTVDPVSAKWGVIAAPRLSPTPSEFRPGVPWKPKAELERDDGKRTEDVDFPDIDSKDLPGGNINGILSSSEKAPPAGVIRPPPGLVAANSFDLHNTDPPVGLLEQSSVGQSGSNKAVKQWLALTGLKPAVDYSPLRMLCQQYGIVLAHRTGQGAIYVCYESQAQAQDACKALNGRIIFDANIVATLITEDDVPNIPDAKIGMPPAPGKPFIPAQFPGMQPPSRPFWDTNGQIGTINPNMPFAPPPMPGMPPGNLLGLGPHLGQWPPARSDPLVNPSQFWPMNLPAQGLLNQAPNYGPWSTNSASPVTAVNVNSTHAAVSPSTGNKLLPDGLFNASESI